jgi:hypothetical protein
MEKIDKILPISLDWYFSMPEGDEILMKIRPMYPSDVKSSDIVIKDLREFVEMQIKTDIQKGFIKVGDITFNRIIVVFDCKKWLNENFLNEPKVKFSFPRTLEWHFKKRLPDTLMSHTSWNVVRNFIEEKFKEFLGEHNKTLFKRKMRILKQVNYNWFDYSADLQFNVIFVRMKPRVLFALAAAAGAAKAALGKI